MSVSDAKNSYIWFLFNFRHKRRKNAILVTTGLTETRGVMDRTCLLSKLHLKQWMMGLCGLHICHWRLGKTRHVATWSLVSICLALSDVRGLKGTERRERRVSTTNTEWRSDWRVGWKIRGWEKKKKEEESRCSARQWWIFCLFFLSTSIHQCIWLASASPCEKMQRFCSSTWFHLSITWPYFFFPLLNWNEWRLRFFLQQGSSQCDGSHDSAA